ncbi:MAG: putative peptidoglycan glycosyltransferase FtsW [Bdellovibrionales bacterium]|nr:putative peptidoglycan glycosyltransferase FtsW [Bdellovibrionales bacterium]
MDSLKNRRGGGFGGGSEHTHSRTVTGLWIAAFALLGLGVVQVYSSSYIFAIESRGDGLFFVRRQFLFAGIAFALMGAVAFTPWRWIERAGWVLWPIAGIGVLMTLIPGMGVKAGGAVRWVSLPGGNVFEPSELIKVSLPLFMATLFARRANGNWFEGLSPLARNTSVFLLLATPLALILRQPDFGTFAIATGTIFAMLFVFGLPWVWIVGTVMVAAPAFYVLVMQVPYRRARVLAFLDPWSVSDTKGFQVIQSMLSLRSGGLFGMGLGEGQGKLFFLPEAHTDFTLAVLGEELGFIGVFLVLSLYGFCLLRAFRLASRATDIFRRALATGLACVFGLSVFVNVGVAMGLLPTKGLTLPFLSYGGSSALMSGLLFGLLLAIERQERNIQGNF